jgi:hypothetical protein
VRPTDPTRHASACAIALATLALATAAATPGAPARLPAIVFVSRLPVPGAPLAIPGLGPHHRAVVTGGRLLVREPDGWLRELLRPGAMFDVSDPSVSRDARRVAFAAVTHPDSAWRLWVVDLDGSDLRQVTFPSPVADLSPLGTAASRFERFDDLDPCWIGDSSLCFASTRYPQRAQYANVPVTNLFETSVPGPGAPAEGRTMRLTAERNGAEEPAMDWRRGRIVFARWWFNRYRAADTPNGIAADAPEAIRADSVNLWQPMEVTLLLHRTRLAAGDLRTRRGSMGYQPAVLADGSIAAVYAANLGLSPQPGGTGIQTVPGHFGAARRLAGAIVPGRAGDVYSGTQGLAPPSACSPVGLPDGRVLFSYSPGARGDFGLYVVNADGSRLTRVLDLPATLELDAAPVVRQPEPPREETPEGDELEDPLEATRSAAAQRWPVPGLPPDLPATRAEWIGGGRGTFRFHDLDVFADGPPGSPARGAAPRTPGARIRFFATLARAERAGGDTAVMLREVAIGPRGEVDERGLPADTPMFEQLVDAAGRVLITARGPAHGAGLNAGVAGFTSRCVGCHVGHSTLLSEPAGHTRDRTRR